MAMAFVCQVDSASASVNGQALFATATHVPTTALGMANVLMVNAFVTNVGR
jgi:hypothetical protein